MASNDSDMGRSRLLLNGFSPRQALDLVKPRQHILVLSHMRSYSSLLCHILNTNPEVAGYVETHQSYARPLPLLRLRARVQQLGGGRLEGRYVLDKLLHNHTSVPPSLLRRDDVIAIFSLREPERTIRSTVAMGRSLPGKDWKANPLKVTRSYIKRLATLRQLAAVDGARSIYLDADDLIGNTDRVLANLTDFLGLRAPLSAAYATSELTGVPRFGDPSQYIRSGTIVRDRDTYADVTVPKDAMARAHDAYERTVTVLRTLENC